MIMLPSAQWIAQGNIAVDSAMVCEVYLFKSHVHLEIEIGQKERSIFQGVYLV